MQRRINARRNQTSARSDSDAGRCSTHDPRPTPEHVGFYIICDGVYYGSSKCVFVYRLVDGDETMIPAQPPTHCDCEIHCRFYPSYDEEHNNPCPFFGKCTSTNDTRRQPQPDALVELEAKLFDWKLDVESNLRGAINGKDWASAFEFQRAKDDIECVEAWIATIREREQG